MGQCRVGSNADGDGSVTLGSAVALPATNAFPFRPGPQRIALTVTVDKGGR